MIFLAALLLTSLGAMNLDTVQQKEDATAIIQVINSFVKGADNKQSEQVATALHDEFRTVLNKAFGQPGVSIIDKKSYLALLAEGKIGGDQRNIEIHSLDIEGDNAFVKARFSGKALIFDTYLLLVKSDTGWQIINDMPKISKL